MPEARVHTTVHEATQVGTNNLTYDYKGNLTTDEHLTALSWDPENRLTVAQVTPDASTTGFGARATYRYDALGRRVEKTVNNRTTLFLNAGAQTIVELESVAIPSNQSQLTGVQSDGSVSSLILPPASGGILATRFNFQPITTLLPAGFLKDTGKEYALRTNNYTYGWSADATANTVARNGAVPLVEFDTFNQMQPDAGGSNSWSVALANGTYPVAVVCGDALSTEQTNDLTIGNVSVTDATPSATASYSQGNFDGYLVLATVTNGILTIAPSGNAYHAKICFVEIGSNGQTITQATIDKLAALIQRANDWTSLTPEPLTVAREYYYGDYVDETLAFTTAANGGGATRSYTHANHLYSPSALTDSSGNVVERYTYDAYGKQAITSAAGTARAQSVVGFDRAITGYLIDTETGLNQARGRYYSPKIGRFISRDPIGYSDGASLYQAYFLPNQLDPSGLQICDKYIYDECGHIIMIVAVWCPAGNAGGGNGGGNNGGGNNGGG
ncbi:MAG: RHS repeat-associated core domain-containing protein, partial [Planctomycetota bacterium]